ncbi:hypothetical protein [Klenkia sp. PcliD-1-E]|uniref:hypothetical protein n=1 Tax=Klenkia sp. PcliD-1-E TaxID=2954492 RepID=UPI00209836E0|nr:hypothetical protein [Klenkia sp. PcliD-1-E]MCO7221554.1 hypothetical protein [Klenkia sp. PcliD-1-E]
MAQSRDQRILSALIAEEKLTRARVELEQTTWRHPITRWRARAKLQQRVVDQERQALSADDLNYLVDRFVNASLEALRTTGKYKTNRHWLHHEVDAYWDQLVADVAQGASLSASRPGGLPARRSSGPSARLAEHRLDALPALVERLTPAAVRQKLETDRAVVRGVASDPSMLTEKCEDGSWIVQHRASGLRAQFSPGIGLPGPGPFGSIFAKWYRIDDLDPQSADRTDPGYYEGLGIGEMIYLHGASLAPGMRWPGGSVATSAGALRRRLHKLDPYIWGADCETCTDHFKDNKDWNDRKRSDFPPH